MKNRRRLIEKRYYTVGEAAYLLGMTPLTLRNWDRQKKLVAIRNPINNYRMYRAEDIERFLRNLERPETTLDII